MPQHISVPEARLAGLLLRGGDQETCVVAQVLSCQHEEGREAMREAGDQGNAVSEKQAEHCARALVDEAMQRHSRDNTTAVVMLLSWV